MPTTEMLIQEFHAA